MKKVIFGLVTVTVLFLLAACFNDLFKPPQLTDDAQPVAETGMGRLTVDLDKPDGRTLLPETPEFSRYAITFHYLAGGVSDINQTVDSLPFSLELLPGELRVTVTGQTYIESVEGILDGYYTTASGESTVTIEAGASVPITVDLSRKSGAKGVFEYDIGLPDDELFGAELNILHTNRTLVETKNLLEAASGSIALDEGYYLVQVRVVTGRVRAKTELMHIYGGHTTIAAGAAWDFDTEEGVFLSVAELSEYLSYAQANTADNPYEVKLITNWASLSVPISGGDEALGQLFRALHGRYVKLDLSGVTGVIGNTYTSYPEELSTDRDKLISVVLPDSLTQIGDGAFYGCSSLEHINFPASLRTIGSSAFSGTLMQSIIQILDLSAYVSLGTIGSSAFSGWTSLEQITLPNTVESIGDYAFYGCISLEQINFPASLRNIGSSAFRETAVTAMDLSACVNLDAIGESAFRDFTSLEHITLPDTIGSIGEYAFYGCTSLEQIIIPNTVETIESNAFYGCTGLTGVTIPASVTSIGDDAFGNCTNLTVTIQTTKIPTTSSSSWNNIFSGNTGLVVIFGNGISSIENYAFSGCTGLIGVTIPDSVTSIGTNAFDGCSGLENVIIGNGVTSIGNSAFYDCTGLTSVIFNGTITSSGFSSTSPFPGDLRTKYFAAGGGLGLYFTTNPGSSAVWYRSPSSITAPAWSEGNTVSLDVPTVTLPAGQTVTAQGWQISGDSSGGWTNFTAATADMSMNRKSLRYYAVSSGGYTLYSNVVIIFVFNVNNIVVTDTTEWNAVKTLISGGGNNQSYIVNINGDIGVAGSAADTFSTATGITVTLQGNGRLRLTSNGSILRIGANQTLIIDSAGLTLQGRSGNDNSLVYVNGSNAQLELRDGTISGNSSSSSSGSGVYVGGSGSSFIMSGGEISGNTASIREFASSASGGGVYVSGTFIMNGGTISGNTASNSYNNPYNNNSYGNGGGVCVFGNFIMSGGEISGNTAYVELGNASGGGVYVSGTFTMNGGEISGNKASSRYFSSSYVSSYAQGGGVFMDSGTFLIVTGTVYGSNEGNVNLGNTVSAGDAIGAALYNGGTAQRGTFSGETWNSMGDLGTTNDTIKVLNGVLQ